MQSFYINRFCLCTFVVKKGIKSLLYLLATFLGSVLIIGCFCELCLQLGAEGLVRLNMVFYGGLKGLVWADIVAGYTMFVMTSYLTDVMNLSFTNAAGVLNLWHGSVLVLQFWLAFLVDSLMGYGPMLLMSTIFLTTGLGFLSISTPPVTGTCKAYEPNCIGQAQKILYYTALVQMAVGLSGHAVSLLPYFRFQVEENLPIRDYSGRANAFEFGVGFSIIIGPITGVLLPAFGKEKWSVLFGIPAILHLLATILFLIGLRWYYPMKPEGSPVTKVARVLTASICKMFRKLPNEPDQLYNPEPDVLKRPPTPGLRFLDKAAILLPRINRFEQQNDKWRLCTVTEVEETKAAVRIVPIATAFIICGLVNSIGNTYFVEQASHMNRKVGKVRIPIFFLLVIFELSKLFYYKLYACITYWLECKGWKKYAPPVGISLAMVFSILCCVTAAKVEARRLNVIVSHDLLKNVEATIPMSMFWLVPQFFLLAGLSSLLEKCVTDFFSDQVPESMRDYLRYFSNGVFGFGTMSSVLTVHFAGKISGRGGRASWFQGTLNESRLDKYYWFLAVMSVANLVLYIFSISFYPTREATEPESENGNDEVETPVGVFPASTGVPVAY